MNKIKLELSRVETIINFANAMMEAADPQGTHSHTSRVAVLAEKLATRIGMEEEDIEILVIACNLHDIGKIFIAETIRNKPTLLTKSERDMIHGHALNGAYVISRLGLSAAIYEIIHHHHEDWDGNGYPDKLKGDQISRSAQIVRITDCYDALTSDRAYRKAFSKEFALKMMADESGKAFNPELFQTFLDMMNG